MPGIQLLMLSYLLPYNNPYYHVLISSKVDNEYLYDYKDSYLYKRVGGIALTISSP
jgi:hypothetical protein